MKRLRRHEKRLQGGERSPLITAGAEVAGALSIASQMALLYPPGFDEWAYRELGGGAEQPSGRSRRR